MKKLQLAGEIIMGFLLVAFSLNAGAEDVTGSFIGNVTDAAHAAVPNAKVILSNADTGLHRETATATDGSYQFLTIPIGDHYSLEVEASGFNTVTRVGITLLVNQIFRSDFQLEVGRVTQQVVVAGNAVQVETTSTQLGDVIDDRKIAALPLNGRSYLDLLGLQAGVVPVNATGYGQAVSGNLTSGQLSVNGQREDANFFMVNGGSVEETGSNGAAIIPTLDSIQEFRLLTSSFDAEYGNFSGGIVNVITKSGTNSFHGTAFEFLRNDAFDAKNFFDNGPKGAFRRNQFGFAAGGRILKNRLFFFSDYQGTRDVIGLTSSLLTVPSAQERQGNFSDVGTTGFAPLTGSVRGDSSAGAMAATLTRRLGYTVSPGEPYWVSGCNSAADATSGVCVFPNQTIPTRAWSPAAASMVNFIPSANASSGGEPLYTISSLDTTVRDDKFGQRIDLNTNKAGTFSFYYHYDNATVGNPLGSSDILGFASKEVSLAQQLNVSNTKTFGTSAVNEFRVNITRIAYPGNSPTEGLGPVSQWGFATSGLGLIPGYPSIEGVPQIVLGQTGINFGAATPVGQFQNALQVTEGYSKILGRHTLKFGGQFGYSQWNQRGTSRPNGEFEFLGDESGNDFADLLLGAPDSFIQSEGQAIDARTKEIGLYGQDSYRISENLTVNYGLRWDVTQPWYDTKGRLETFVPGKQSQLYANAPTGWVFPGDPGIPSTLAPTRYGDVAPRLGIAFSPSGSDGISKFLLGTPGKTSIHAATGIFFTDFSTTGAGYENGDVPFGIFYVSPAPVYLDLPFQSRVSANNPGQKFPYVKPSTDGSWSQLLPIGDSPAYNINNVVPYSIDVNMTVQRQIGSSTVVTVGYVASMGRHLFSQIDFNPGNAARCLQIRALFEAAGQPGAGCGPGGEDSIYSIAGQTFYGTRPYSVTSGRYASQGILDFTDNTYESTIGGSSYNSLQLTVNKSIGRARFLAAYTYSKAMDNASGFFDLVNPYNPSLSRSLSAFDVTNNFVVNYSYDLPFQRLAPQHGRLVNGWSISGITRLTTGIPITLSNSGDQSLCGCESLGNSSVDIPNYNGAPIQKTNPRHSPNFQYFSAAPFSEPSLGQVGNADRRFFHGPGLNNTDLSLVKNLQIKDRFSLDFRADFFNVFNHAQFTSPVGDFAASNFGQITAANDPRIGQFAVKLHF